jgi:hypothetical protein
MSITQCVSNAMADGISFKAPAQTVVMTLDQACRDYRLAFLASMDPLLTKETRKTAGQLEDKIKKGFEDQRIDMFEKCEGIWYAKSN